MTNFLQTPPRLPDAWTDVTLRSVLLAYLGEELFAVAEPMLAAAGKVVTSTDTLELAARAEREPPVHVPFSAWGERIDEITVSDAYVELGRIGVSAGVTALPYEETPYGEKARLAWGGLMVLWGPSSALYNCPIAMTDAAARTLLEHGDATDLPVVERLTTRDPDRAWTSGQWMTETAGGSDVSRTGTVARLQEGAWRLYGTKWFTSATTSEMALTLARPEGIDRLALFRIHRVLDDGTRNEIVVRRLKDKLGTRSLPTAELELQGALATPVGDPTDGRGVARIATMLNITRIHNALGSTGSLARGLAWARAYARVREVFGRPLYEQPAHRATLTDLAVDYAASLALTLRCCELTGKAEHGEADQGDVAVLRGLVPVTKLATARWAVAGVTEAMEAVGGVGYCEDSTIPALVRNTHVQPIWEGTTNVLSLDLLRAAERSGAIDALLTDIRAMAPDGAVRRAADELAGRAEAFAGDAERAQAEARPLALGLAQTYACALLLKQGERAAGAARRLVARGLVPAAAPSDLDLAFDETPEPSKP